MLPQWYSLGRVFCEKLDEVNRKVLTIHTIVTKDGIAWVLLDIHPDPILDGIIRPYCHANITYFCIFPTLPGKHADGDNDEQEAGVATRYPPPPLIDLSNRDVSLMTRPETSCSKPQISTNLIWFARFSRNSNVNECLIRIARILFARTSLWAKEFSICDRFRCELGSQRI